MTNDLTVSESAAKALYTGMVTDSGRFKYDSTTPRTFQLAAFLMEHNSHLSDIYKGLYADDFNMIRLRASFVMKIQFTEENVAYIYTSNDELKSLGYDLFTISRGMVGTMSDIRGVDVWANFTESDEGVICEIRSNKYNINPVAVKYGGGGHAKASGATLKDKDEAMRLLSDLDTIVKEGKNNE
jgi:phosphoesterase RecJ-like protein